MHLSSYDRLFPSQDVHTGRGMGNLIAAPMNGKRRQHGTTVFLDPATLEPYEDQWAYLSSIARLSTKDVTALARQLPDPQIGHNVRIGRHCLIVAQAGISGSTELGDFVGVGGQAGFAEHLEIGNRAQIAAQSGVNDDLPAKARVGGTPARPLRTWLRGETWLAQEAAQRHRHGSTE